MYAMFLYMRKEDFKNTKDQARINSQRNVVEKSIYSSESRLLDDSFNFVDSTKLLIKYAPQSPVDDTIPNLSFFQELQINFSAIQVEKNKAFCLMPFNDMFKSIYNAISNGCREAGVSCCRSDESYNPGNLLKQIILSISKSQFIFAVLDGRNPNVFYEIGLCHAIGKPVYLIAHHNQKDKIPFDLASSRLVLYNSNKNLTKQIKELISQQQDQNG